MIHFVMAIPSRDRVHPVGSILQVMTKPNFCFGAIPNASGCTRPRPMAGKRQADDAFEGLRADRTA